MGGAIEQLEERLGRHADAVSVCKRRGMFRLVLESRRFRSLRWLIGNLIPLLFGARQVSDLTSLLCRAKLQINITRAIGKPPV